MVASHNRLSTAMRGPAELRLADGFTPPSHAQWQREVEKVLRRSGMLAEDAETPERVESLLDSTTYDGIALHPLYTRSTPTETAPEAGFPGIAPFVRGSRPEGSVAEGWEVRAAHAHPSAEVTNREILADLAGGATGLLITLGDHGLPVDRLADALQDVHLDMITVALEAGERSAEAAEALLSVAREQGVQPSALHGNLGADPISIRARTGQDTDPADAVRLAKRCAGNYPHLQAITVDGTPYHEAGGSDSEELGCALAAATTYLRWLTEAGMDVDAAANVLEFRFAATGDQFLTIAKLRAARRLWDQVTRACGVSEPNRAQRQHAVTSSAMMTRRDPWVNMLRTTVATFAAGMGGAQAITVRPFDAAIGLPDSFARRVARNTQNLLLEESHLAQVIDPAGGSWYVESLTDELARAAWQWFQRIEGAGGLPDALDSGLVADTLDETWQRRRSAIAHRTDPLTGVSEFPHLGEPTLTREPNREVLGGGLPKVRYAQDFEALRDAADAAPTRPAVFLATLGPIAAHTARASFTRNLLAAGGIEAVEAGATDSTEDVVAAYRESPSAVVCLCGGDRLYAERGAETVAALKAAGAEHVLVAGKPELSDVDGFVHKGGNALETLQNVHRRLGVQR